MKFVQLAILSATVGAACAFAPLGPALPAASTVAATSTSSTFSLRMSTEPETETEEDTTYSILSEDSPPNAPDFTPGQVNAFGSDVSAASSASASAAAINGWVADEGLPCYGLPGVLPPTGFFDPLGFAQRGISLNEVKRNREAEVMHGRVAMIACVGYFAGEQLPSPFGINGPANDQLQQVPLPAFILLTLGIAAAELKRATIGWVEPDLSDWTKTLWKLRDNYYPGDVGFDPLNFKPTDPTAFANMQTRELQNGRLAMLGWAGMCSQELVNHKSIADTIDFYQKVYSGVNPYETM
eukprot:CAMPEP_0197729082 /NCGR_PEP_ID=MMETSP1434-20131217/29408_1 /TAXON_ID=265543 /ORGANISM="Minutocellus polymorphus, Strain CCMP3303" /LENGTH=296 /DNA_ID=CAMNT_0043315663 /DNA_START=117 /DNA_END=1007 /DNA_ORIENTATION=+